MKKTNIDNLFTKFTKETPGCAVCVMQNGTIVLERCFGLADLKNKIPIKPNTAFRLASLTKPFTAMAIMILTEKKLLKYDDSLKKFFSDFPNYGKDITIRQLLTHSSGMPDHEKLLYKRIKRGEEPTMYDALRVLKKERRLLFLSGAKCRYSDSGFVILALIVEKVAQQKYAKFLLENIFQPLGMQDTVVLDETKPFIQKKAIGYRRSRGTWIEYDYNPLNYIVGDEGIYSTVRDLFKWEKAWFTEVLVSKQTLRQALTPVKLNNGKNGKWGFSWFIKNQFLFQPGSWVGFNNIIFINLSRKTTVFFLSNTTEFPKRKDKLMLAMRILKETNI